MPTATKLQDVGAHTLYRLSPPLRGFRICGDGNIARKPVTHVLVAPGRVLESNPDGDLVGWGTWAKSRCRGDVAETLSRVGYDVQD